MTSPRQNLKKLVTEASELYGKMEKERNLNLIRSSKHATLVAIDNTPEDKQAEFIIESNTKHIANKSILTFGSNRRLDNFLNALTQCANILLNKSTLDVAIKAIEATRYNTKTTETAHDDKKQAAMPSAPIDAKAAATTTPTEETFENSYDKWAEKAVTIIKAFPTVPSEQLLQAKISELEQQLQKANDEKETEHKLLIAKKLELQTIDAQFTETRKKLSSSEALNSTLTKDLTTAQKEKKDAEQAHIAHTNDIINNYEQKISAVNQQKYIGTKKLDEDIADALSKLKISEAACSIAKRDLQKLQLEKSILDQKFSQVKKDLEAALLDTKLQIDNNRNLEAQLADQKSTTKNTLKSLQDMSKKYKAECLARLDLDKRLKETESKLNEVFNQNPKPAKLHKQIAELEDKLEKLQVQYTVLEDSKIELTERYNLLYLQRNSIALKPIPENDAESNSLLITTRSRKTKAGLPPFGLFDQTHSSSNPPQSLYDFKNHPNAVQRPK